MIESDRAAGVVRLLEDGAAQELWPRLALAVQESIDRDRLNVWTPALDEWIGKPRHVRSAQSHERLLLEGPRGVVSVGVHFDSDGAVTSVEIAPWATDGIRNIVVGTPRGVWNEDANRAEGEPRELGEFYAGLLDLRILRDDWIIVGEDGVYPRIAFGDGWSDERPPRWGDPSYPVQGRLELFSSDVAAAEQRAVGLGATKLDAGDKTLYADPFGHPFSLEVDPRESAESRTSMRLGRIVFDCADPREVASFWSELLDMRDMPEESPQRIVIANVDGSLPMLGFERVPDYVAPRWGDPLYPEQIHVDLFFNDPGVARENAERLGATVIPPPRGSCPVYVDPAGHPFCLCANAGGEEPYVVDLLSPGG